MLTIMQSTLLLLALPVTSSVGTGTLKVTLKPALAFHEILTDVDDRLFFRVVIPQPENQGCTPQCPSDNFDALCDTVCGGSFAMDLSAYDSLQISLEARAQGQEIWLRSGAGVPRIRAEFFAAVKNCTIEPDMILLNKKPRNSKVEILGNNTAELKANLNEQVRPN
jgi:hypothetical protein